ncbi:MAG: terminase large subunit [Gemmataceae bacterium]
MTDPVTQYAIDVVEKRLVVGELVRHACERHLRDLARGPERGLVWNPTQAQGAIEFFKVLRHSKSKWRGKPFELQPWQQFCVGSIWGWRKEDGTRRFRRFHNEVARKNGKSTMAAGIALGCGILDFEGAPEVYAAATSRPQARLTFNEAHAMVRASPALRRRCHPYRDAITLPRGGTFIPLSADSEKLDGLNVHAAVCDEMHAWRDRLLWDVLETAVDARPQPLLIITTTAGYDLHSIWWELRQHAIKILTGVVEDDDVFAYIATLDEKDDWTDPAVWVKANPNLGVIIDPVKFAKKVRDARITPGKQNAFKRLHLNIPTESASMWIDIELWDACYHDFHEDLLKGQSCCTGLDVSAVRDLTAAAHVFKPEDDETPIIIVPRFWLPQDDLEERGRIDGVDYQAWADAGHLNLIPGPVIRPDFVERDLLQDAEKFQIDELVVDRYLAMHTAMRFKDQGFNVIGFGQGFASMKQPVMDFERDVATGRIWHNGNPILRWCIANTAVEQNSPGDRKPCKKKSTGRIDGTVAALMGVGRIALAPDSRSIYDREEEIDLEL